MSSEIFYDRAFIRVGERYMPVVNHGASNCFDIDHRGREIPEKHWSVINYPHWEKMLFTAEEMKEVAAAYEKVSMDNQGGTRKSRYRSFEEGEFYRWILGGMKTAHSVEEYQQYGNTVIIIDYSTESWRKISVSSTDELLNQLEVFKGSSNFTVSFLNSRYVKHPPMRAKKQPTDFEQLPEFFVLRAAQGYFVKRSSKRVWFMPGKELFPARVRKFKTEAAARKYLQENADALSKFAFRIERIQNGDTE